VIHLIPYNHGVGKNAIDYTASYEIEQDFITDWVANLNVPVSNCQLGAFFMDLNWSTFGFGDSKSGIASSVNPTNLDRSTLA
jgi:hypothetical protein